MTLVALSVEAKEVQVLTDTMSYLDGSCAVTSHTTKARTLPHLDSVVVGQGVGYAADMFVASVLLTPAEHARPGVRSLFERAPAVLRDFAGDTTDAAAEVFIAGWDPEAGRMRGRRFSSRHDFEEMPLEDFLVYPAPITDTMTLPCAAELDSIKAQVCAQLEGDVPASAVTLELPDSVKPYPRPRQVKEWVRLGQVVHASRSAQVTSLPVLGTEVNYTWPTGGDLQLTRIRPGECVTRTVGSLPPLSEEAARVMFGGTLHPAVQRADCECGSGRAFFECCLPKYADQPCLCGQGLPIGQCCALFSPKMRAYRDAGSVP